ncbi:MAG: DNA repair protein RecO [Eubacteriales bacterium]
MNQIEVTGMVLVAGGIGEYDRRIELLTKERGRISAFAKGARRPTSSLVSATNPFVFGKFTLYAGRNSYTVVHAEIENYFAELRMDIEAAYYGFYFLEVASYYTREGSEATELLKLLYQTFRALTKNTISRALIRVIFELKAMTIEGEGPQVFQCLTCGNDKFESVEQEVVFSSQSGGIVCRECMAKKSEYEKVINMDNSTMYAMQYIVCSSIEKLYTFKVDNQVLHKMQKITQKYMAQYVDKQFKSLEMLDVVAEINQPI